MAAALAVGPPVAGAEDTPRIALIIDDIGQQLEPGRRAVALPGPVALAFLPHRPHVERLARAAERADKEILLHLPLQAEDRNRLGPGAVTLDMTRAAFRRTFRENLAAVPHVDGVNTHMGSMLTRHPGHMDWLMAELRAQAALFFVDSYTTDKSIATEVAADWGVPHARRDVFLDGERSREAIARQFERLMQIARDRGLAVGIGHPHPETLSFLEQALPALPERGIELVPLRELVSSRSEERPWQPYSSP